MDKTCPTTVILASSQSYLLECINGDMESLNPELFFNAAKMSPPGLILSSSPYLRSARGAFFLDTIDIFQKLSEEPATEA